MTYEEKFNIALGFENAGISIDDLEALQNAMYNDDQELINTTYQWMQMPLEMLDIKPSEIQGILRWIYDI